MQSQPGSVRQASGSPAAVLRFLTRTGAVLASAADPDAAFRQLARLLVEEGFCDACYFDVVDETLHVKRVAWAHRRPEKQAEYDVLWPKVRPRPYLDHPAAAMIANEQPIFTPVVDEAWMRKIASGEAHLEYMRREHIRSVIVVPLMTLSTPYGAITLNLTEDPVTPYTEFDLALAMELGWRCAFAISNGRKQAALQKLNADLETEVLRRTKERDRIWSVSNDLMSVAGADGYLKSVNPAWSRVLGYDEATLLSTPFMQLGAPGAQSGGLAVMARLENGESITRYESRLRHADGSYRWFDWKVVPEDGLYYAVGRDITEERARAAELETSNRELQRQIEERERVEGAMREMQRLEAVGQLTAGVAHDFNNLLQIITGTVSLLDRDVPADSAQGRRLQNIKLAAQRGSKLTSQLLAFARRQNLVPQDIDIRATLEGMEELLRTTMGQDVSVSLSLPESAVLRADPTQLELVLINLAINARDAMNGKGQLTVTVGTEEIDAPLSPSDAPRGRYIAISVSDTGTGMAPDVAERAFEPFFTTKPVGRGSGLGLSQVVGFAKQSGGGVRLRTAPGQGTTVTVLLPASASASPHEDAVPSPKPETAARATKQTILVVDDEHLVREVMTEHLRGQGYTVHDAATPGAALDLLAVGVACDAAVVDFSMPGMNGQELAAHIRKRLPDLPVLFVTGYAGAREFSAMPRSALLEKPFTDAQLIAKLDALLRADSA